MRLAFGSASLAGRLWRSYAVLLLALLATGGLGVAGLRRQRNDLREIVEVRWAHARAARDAVALVNGNLQSRLRLFLAADSARAAELLAQQTAQSKRISQVLQS